MQEGYKIYFAAEGVSRKELNENFALLKAKFHKDVYAAVVNTDFGRYHGAVWEFEVRTVKQNLDSGMTKEQAIQARDQKNALPKIFTKQVSPLR